MTIKDVIEQETVVGKILVKYDVFYIFQISRKNLTNTHPHVILISCSYFVL